MGIGDWGLGIGPIHNPNPHFYLLLVKQRKFYNYKNNSIIFKPK
jgi:hypothetical protein